MDDSCKWGGVASSSALRSEVAGCSALLEAAAGRPALPELLEAAEDMKRCMATVKKVARLRSLSGAMRSYAHNNFSLRTLA